MDTTNYCIQCEQHAREVAGLAAENEHLWDFVTWVAKNNTTEDSPEGRRARDLLDTLGRGEKGGE